MPAIAYWVEAPGEDHQGLTPEFENLWLVIRQEEGGQPEIRGHVGSGVGAWDACRQFAETFAGCDGNQPIYGTMPHWTSRGGQARAAWVVPEGDTR